LANEFHNAAIKVYLTLKGLLGMSPYQIMEFAESLLQLVELDWAGPDFSILSRYQKILSVSLPDPSGINLLHADRQ
jgi:hypothetical protein